MQELNVARPVTTRGTKQAVNFTDCWASCQSASCLWYIN